MGGELGTTLVLHGRGIAVIVMETEVSSTSPSEKQISMQLIPDFLNAMCMPIGFDEPVTTSALTESPPIVS